MHRASHGSSGLSDTATIFVALVAQNMPTSVQMPFLLFNLLAMCCIYAQTCKLPDLPACA